jgi:hypothetical protein
MAKPAVFISLWKNHSHFCLRARVDRRCYNYRNKLHLFFHSGCTFFFGWPRYNKFSFERHSKTDNENICLVNYIVCWMLLTLMLNSIHFRYVPKLPAGFSGAEPDCKRCEGYLSERCSGGERTMGLFGLWSAAAIQKFWRWLVSYPRLAIGLKPNYEIQAKFLVATLVSTSTR